MKELYISPELEILRFLPMERIATDPDWVTDIESTSESLPGDHDHYDPTQDPTVDPFD